MSAYTENKFSMILFLHMLILAIITGQIINNRVETPSSKGTCVTLLINIKIQPLLSKSLLFLIIFDKICGKPF